MGVDTPLTNLCEIFPAGLMGRMRSQREKEKTAKVSCPVSLADFYTVCETLSVFSMKSFCLSGRNERTVVMDKSKGEPVISVKTKSKERVSNLSVLHS